MIDHPLNPLVANYCPIWALARCAEILGELHDGMLDRTVV
jgi:hypothetical protein